MIIIHYHLR